VLYFYIGAWLGNSSHFSGTEPVGGYSTKIMAGFSKWEAPTC